MTRRAVAVLLMVLGAACIMLVVGPASGLVVAVGVALVAYGATTP